jgi:hypothetical protein
MSLPNQVVMPSDVCQNPYIIPGTTRKYSCSVGSSIVVPGDDAMVLKNAGWIGGELNTPSGAGPTSGRPLGNLQIGTTYHDTTLSTIIIYAGPKTGWVHHSTGAAS